MSLISAGINHSRLCGHIVNRQNSVPSIFDEISDFASAKKTVESEPWKTIAILIVVILNSAVAMRIDKTRIGLQIAL